MPLSPPRPRLTRETRLLLATVVASIVALWALGRWRFPERDATANPVPAVLAPLGPSSSFEDLAADAGRMSESLTARVVVLTLPRESSGAMATCAALRLGGGLGIVLERNCEGTAAVDGAVPNPVIATDRASGLMLVNVPDSDVPGMAWWAPRRLETPRYLLASEVVGRVVSWRPVYVGALVPQPAQAWRGDVLAVPRRSELVAGSFVFTLSGTWAGLVADINGKVAVVLPATVMAAIDELRRDGRPEPATLGVDVAALTAAVTKATAATQGVIVTWVDPAGTAGGRLTATDVIETIDGEGIQGLEQWEARVARLRPGRAVRLGVRRAGTRTEIVVEAAPIPVVPRDGSLGLTLRSIRGAGALVVSVRPNTVADRAGVMSGDLITRIGDRLAPTAAEVASTFEATPPGQPLLIALTRDRTHAVKALER